MTDKIPDAVIDQMAYAFQNARLSTSNSDVNPLHSGYRIAAMLAAAEALGWKLVPREPTEAMKMAANLATAYLDDKSARNRPPLELAAPILIDAWDKAPAAKETSAGEPPATLRHRATDRTAS